MRINQTVKTYLESEIVILLFFCRTECIPPFAQDFADSSIVLVRMALMNESSVSLTEDHESVHRPSHVFL